MIAGVQSPEKQFWITEAAVNEVHDAHGVGKPETARSSTFRLFHHPPEKLRIGT